MYDEDIKKLHDELLKVKMAIKLTKDFDERAKLISLEGNIRNKLKSVIGKKARSEYNDGRKKK